jgi:hypothetical protein
MPEYFTKLPWPKLPNCEYLINKINEYPEHLYNQNGYKNYQQAGNLKNWPTVKIDTDDILNELPIDYSVAQHVSLQRILPPSLPWHIDRNRAVAAMAVITGTAWTVFQEPKGRMQRICFEPNVWYMFNGLIPHCVKGLKEVRVSLCIDLSQTYNNYESAKNELLY